jgi:tetratricopeptide (TPR) repeat protein
MNQKDREILFKRARVALNQGRLTEAANMFAALADDCDHDARFLSYRGLLLAIRERRVSEGTEMCKRAIALASSEAEMYLNLARLYTSTGQRQNAVTTLRRAIRAGAKNKAVMQEIQRLSPRALPPIKSLHRDHVLNDVLGKLRARLFRARRGKSQTKPARGAAMRDLRTARQRG